MCSRSLRLTVDMETETPLNDKSYEEIGQYYSALMDEEEWHRYLHADDITPARLRWQEDTFCVECGGLYPRTADYWPIVSERPFRLGKGICLECLPACRERGTTPES